MSRELFKTGIVVITIMLVLLAISACGGGSDEATEPESTPTPTEKPVTVTTIPSPSKSQTPEPRQTPEKTEALTPSPTSAIAPVATSEPAPASTPMPTATPVPTSTLTPDITVEATPVSTATPETPVEPESCSFNGYVAIDDASVDDGTVISAWIDGELVGSAATKGSAYEMTISGDYAGKVVSFKIGSYKANQTSVWENGGDIVVGLSVRLGPPVCGFYGTVTHPGGTVPDDTVITAIVEGAAVGSTSVTGSWYYLILTGEYSGKTVQFRVGSDQTIQSSTWERGGNKHVDLTVIAP